ncbi:MAG TPA: ATP-binding protein [Verrucomicrobiae bacterium]|nr:ATP-binding protein [Verrucomicrobiae bacterium]
MNLQTNLAGRLRNTPLPLSNALMPLFEAVVNSIHAIEEAGQSTSDGKIDVAILRKQGQEEMQFEEFKKRGGPDALQDIIGFIVTDTGIGFTDENFESFKTLDSEHKISKGGRGIGRLLWLKAFKRVHIDSVYEDHDAKLMRRTFTFDASGVYNENLCPADAGAARKTVVRLDDFNARYRQYALKTPEPIANSILEHCLWYYIRKGSAPTVSVLDDGQVFSLSDIFDHHMHSSAVPETLTLKGCQFDVVHVKLRSNSLATHALALCADIKRTATLSLR